MKACMLVGALSALVAGSFADVFADDYGTFEEGLQKSSVKVNDVHLPGLVYSIDEATGRRYFAKYFADHRCNRALRVNLGYAVFHWGRNHEALQKALLGVFPEQIERFFTGKDTAALKRVMAGDKTLHNHYFFMLCFLVDLLGSDRIPLERKAKVGQRLYAALGSSPICRRDQRLPTAKYPVINLVKAQFLLTCFSYADKCGQMKALEPLLEQQGTRKALLDRYGLLLADNGFCDGKQARAIAAYLEAMPSHLRYPIAVTCYDRLVGKVEGGGPVSVHDFACSTNRFNVFATRVGTAPNNQFPRDYKEVKTDGFMIVFAHEHNHGVDARHIHGDPVLKAFRQRLLEKAGDRRGNYLRSMFGDRFFQQNPQEFVASIANMYCASSEDTFLYALQKARAGNYNQINQFVLMASAYSDEESCPFFRIEPSGRTTVKRYPIRKTEGIVSSIVYRGKRFRFQIEEGVVTGLSRE